MKTVSEARIQALAFFMVGLFMALMVGGCDDPPSSHTSAVQDSELRQQILDARARLRLIRESLGTNGLSDADREFVGDAAVNGEMVNSALAFLTLQMAVEDDLITRPPVLELYVRRLAKTYGMDVILTMRNLESLLVPDIRADRWKREELVAIVRRNKSSSTFGSEEIRFAEGLAASPNSGDTVLLLGLLLSKRAGPRYEWVMKQIRSAEQNSRDPSLKELIQVCRTVLAERER